MEDVRKLMVGPRKSGESPRTFWLADAVAPDDSLCSVCRRIDFQAVVTQEAGSYEFANLGLYVDIRQKAASCRFCRLVVGAVIEGWRPIVDWESCSHLELTECGLDDRLAVQVYPIPPEAAEEKIRVGGAERCIIDVLADDVERIGMKSPLFHSRVVPKEVADIVQMKEWLHICQEFHGSACGKEIDANICNIPSSLRVIDIRHQRLVPVNTDTFWSKKTRRYVALSYVWGQVSSVAQYQTTQANFQQRTKKGGLSTVPFPRTIRDAMVVTSLLGERYLWVDAACIIQDSDADEAAQITGMNVVYGAASLTIVAAGGSDAECALPRAHVGSPHPVVQKIEKIAGVRVALPITRLWNLENIPQLTPMWFTRGWTYQERQLSVRLLFFTPEQVYFQCRCSGFCEDQKAEQHSPNPINPPGSPAGNNLRMTQPSHFFMRTYGRLVENYTARHLSFDSDALNAFMGVGAVLVELFGPHYTLQFGLAGPFLEEAMTWQPAAVEAMIRRPQFPSWSWAGWRGPVKYATSSTDWMLLDGAHPVTEHTVPAEDGFLLHPGPIRLPGPPQRKRVYDGQTRAFTDVQKPYARPPPPPPSVDLNPNRIPPKEIPAGTLEFITTVAPGSAFALMLGDQHQDGCTCFQYGAKAPLQAKCIRRMVDAAGVTCGSMGSGESAENAGKTRMFVCLARTSGRGASVSCPGFDTRVYERVDECCFEVLLLEYEESGVAERVAAGRVHEDAWVVAEGLQWERVWLR